MIPRGAASDPDPIELLRRDVTRSCRLLARLGIMREITGHVSARIPGTDDMLVRCRPREDPGVSGTVLHDVKRVSLDGASAELGDGHTLPGEFSLHAELYRRRPDVGSIVHGHPRSSLLCGLLELPLRPIVGAYDPGAMRLALGSSVPMYPRAVLIRTPELGRAVADAMGDARACVLRGHGVVTAGPTVEEATVTAIKLETLAEITVQAASTGRIPDAIAEEDIAELTAHLDQGDAGATYLRWTWNFYLREYDVD